ncbi:hypothetical protein GE253_19460 [Niveispirillum sp. SYP-B3756]|uniref:hypothetical protein n=1 Tax=Niveispirillum sp. SYP-B3756 TaxID=2662178 RepID=UPI00129205DC|nr:hypothetical protein [Niveispirillum sp. SYP-B3756]MQP67508.1 hypothetical protein [Niveispirillum sp. SYP-B3756]
MSGLVAIREAIATRLLSVPEIGRVHDWERPFTTAAGLQQFYGWPAETAEAPIRGWCVTLRRFCGSPARTGRGRRITCQWRITGYLSLQDAAASEITLTGLIDNIAAAFDADPTLGGTVSRCAKGEPPDTLAGIQFRKITVLRLPETPPCHEVWLTLPTQHFA